MAKITHALLKFAEFSNVGGNRTAAFVAIKYQVRPEKPSEGQLGLEEVEEAAQPADRQ